MPKCLYMYMYMYAHACTCTYMYTLAARLVMEGNKNLKLLKSKLVMQYGYV